ncbi:hypothetical protein FISHEDRAFT_55268 [Fistulina hepatica ATCC 64428]|uniref:Uncharacterized protein n=1 Tax=Fistulina hepatica ATCC 64428 TaxID=1128425 RepID=A0A0D7AN85_9AGAR|nr:hypothetical protein FISHEDRAFT_55268 [Fistulina hepatica ATCC 64428]
MTVWDDSAAGQQLNDDVNSARPDPLVTHAIPSATQSTSEVTMQISADDTVDMLRALVNVGDDVQNSSDVLRRLTSPLTSLLNLLSTMIYLLPDSASCFMSLMNDGASSMMLRRVGPLLGLKAALDETFALMAETLVLLESLTWTIQSGEAVEHHSFGMRPRTSEVVLNPGLPSRLFVQSRYQSQLLIYPSLFRPMPSIPVGPDFPEATEKLDVPYLKRFQLCFVNR